MLQSPASASRTAAKDEQRTLQSHAPRHRRVAKVPSETATYRAPSVVASVWCAAEQPTRIERGGSMECARANASGRPGSGGRHQQLGGPAGCGQTASSTGPLTASCDAGRLPRSEPASPSGVHSKSRCGAAGLASASASAMPARASARAPTNTPARPPATEARANGTLSTAANPSSIDGGSSSRSARIWDVGSINHGSRRLRRGSGRAPGASRTVPAAARRG